MKMLKAIIISGLLLGLVMPILEYPVDAGDGKENLAIIVHPGVPVTRLSDSELEAIFTSGQRNWSDGSNISTFSYAPEDPVRRAFDSIVLRMSPEEVARFWLDQRVRGGARPPRQVPEAALAVRLVAKLPGSIAYVPEGMVNSSVKVVARVRGGKVVEP
jgi:ABC-type phosphate transport system substrate-binding protein